MNDREFVTCPVCGGEGVVDSGGQTPWGEWIDLPCPLCDGKPITAEEVRAAGFHEQAKETEQ